MTVCCPCITFGRNAVIVGRNQTLMAACCWSGLVFCLLADIGISCLYSYRYRYKLRQQYKLPESPCGDCLVHWCCTPCAVCQEHRELKNRGIDPSKGWEVVSAMTPPEIATGMPRA
ncbi:Protein PLANT CADMIUM RESISTANCE 9 [Linum perenne]